MSVAFWEEVARRMRELAVDFNQLAERTSINAQTLRSWNSQSRRPNSPPHGEDALRICGALGWQTDETTLCAEFGFRFGQTRTRRRVAAPLTGQLAKRMERIDGESMRSRERRAGYLQALREVFESLGQGDCIVATACTTELFMALMNVREPAEGRRPSPALESLANAVRRGTQFLYLFPNQERITLLQHQGIIPPQYGVEGVRRRFEGLRRMAGGCVNSALFEIAECPFWSPKAACWQFVCRDAAVRPRSRLFHICHMVRQAPVLTVADEDANRWYTSFVTRTIPLLEGQIVTARQSLSQAQITGREREERKAMLEAEVRVLDHVRETVWLA